jgi:hypothetical protein
MSAVDVMTPEGNPWSSSLLGVQTSTHTTVSGCSRQSETFAIGKPSASRIPLRQVLVRKSPIVTITLCAVAPVTQYESLLEPRAGRSPGAWGLYDCAPADQFALNH